MQTSKKVQVPLAPISPLFHEYNIIKQTATLPLKITIFFNTLQTIANSNINQDVKYSLKQNIAKQSNRQYLFAFQSLSFEEQARYMEECIKFVTKHCTKKDTQQIKKTQYDPIRNIESSADLYTTKFKIPIWVPYNFKFDKDKNLVTLTQRPKNKDNSNIKVEIINLKNYLVRRSKKYKGCVILQGASQQCKFAQKKYTLYFENNVDQQIYRQLFEAVLNIKKYQLQQILQNRSNSLDSRLSMQSDAGQKLPAVPQSGYLFLTPKNIQQFLAFKKQTLKFLRTQMFDFRQISLPHSHFRIEQSYRYFKVFRLEGHIATSPRDAKINILQHLSTMRNKLVISNQILESVGNFEASYEKYLFGNFIYQLITIRENDLQLQPQPENSDSKGQQSQDIIFIRGLSNIMLTSFLEEVTIKIRPSSLDPKQSQMLILAEIKLSEVVNIQRIKLLMYNLYMGAFPSKTQKLMQQKIGLDDIQEDVQGEEDKSKITNGGKMRAEHITVHYHEQKNKEVILQQNNQQIQVQQKQQIKPLKEQQLITKIKQRLSKTSKIAYSSFKNEFYPAPKINKKQHLESQNMLLKKWKRKAQGGLIYKQKQKVTGQQKEFKDILTRYGNNILKNPNILSVSVPITTFGKQSHLQAIAGSFCYAPVIFENIKTISQAIERIKYATLLAISVGTLSIRLERPLNPELGETWQGWIGGCPIYVEQININPPTSSYYLIGQKYKIYGQITPKLYFGMNNLKCYSENLNYIQFEDSTKIQLIFSKMIVHGLIFGDRQLNFQDKIFAFDKKNKIFAEVIYGPRKKNMFSKNAEPWDLCHGKIYEVTEQFVKLYQSSSIIMHYPIDKHITKQLSTLEGVWNESVSFDGIQYMNFKNNLPYKLVGQKFVLPSNSTYRDDLAKYKQGNIKQAQFQKYLTQQSQKRDKKLRQQKRFRSRQSITNTKKKGKE